VIVQDVLADPKWENIAEQIKGMDISVLVNNVGGGTPGFVFRSN
jgi:short-subunit dehydrogenase